jgi:hypothetical protein
MLVENLRCAFRNLRSAPGFTLTAILSLGIGMAGTVCMFTLLKSIVLITAGTSSCPLPDRL